MSPQVLLGSNETSQSSVTLESIVHFLDQLTQASNLAGYAIIEGGGLDFLFNSYLAGFSDPLAPNTIHTRVNLRVACDSLLDAFSKTEQGLKYIHEHRIHILWPTTPNLQFTNTMSDRIVAHAEVWRSIESRSVSSRLALTLNIVGVKGVYCPELSQLHPLDDIVNDVLEFWG